MLQVLYTLLCKTECTVDLSINMDFSNTCFSRLLFYNTLPLIVVVNDFKNNNNNSVAFKTKIYKILHGEFNVLLSNLLS